MPQCTPYVSPSTTDTAKGGPVRSRIESVDRTQSVPFLDRVDLDREKKTAPVLPFMGMS
jgi:hypothetical protein